MSGDRKSARPGCDWRMKPTNIEPESTHFPTLSKRAARRVIQRAFVLLGRDRSIRQHLREARLNTLWTIEDWGLEWTVSIEHTKFEFHRGRTGRPDVTYVWQRAEDFFKLVETGASPAETFDSEGSREIQKLLGPVLAAFAKSLNGVLQHPFDDVGERLL
jgi:hypothetical protein